MAALQAENMSKIRSTPGPSRTCGLKTSHARDHCRRNRTKCTNGIIWARCVSDDATCVYNGRKREGDKRRVAVPLHVSCHLTDGRRMQAECRGQRDALATERGRLLTALHSITRAYQTRVERTPELTEVVRQVRII